MRACLHTTHTYRPQHDHRRTTTHTHTTITRTHRVRGEGGRYRFIGRERAYHGVGFGGISVGGILANRRTFGPMLPGVDHLPATYSREHQAFSKGQPEWGTHLADDLERLVNLHDASTIAAVMVEPVSGSAGVLVPPKGYLKVREGSVGEGLGERASRVFGGAKCGCFGSRGSPPISPPHGPLTR